MSRLIDVDQFLIDESEEYISAQSKTNDSLLRDINKVVHKEIQLLISNAPTVDAVQVVRCKDCKHFHLDYMANVNDIPLIVAHEICCFNEENPIKVLQNHFCSWGERRTE